MLEHEYALRADLDPTWAVRPRALLQHQGRPCLVLDDPGGELLAQRLGTPPMDIGLCLRLGVGLAAALGALHRRGIIHKDLTPGHVMIDVATGQVWLTGFRIASRLRRERQTPEPPEVIAGTLPYMAPEQTGRMNRSIDSRSDLYSFGVILYEMVTGTLPFTASDPMEWVHCHTARQPVPPAERAIDVPPAVAGIIMRLLAKTAEQRYQTAAGVERDLRRCLTQWEAEHRIDEFPLGEHDTPDRLLIPETLYGREREIETLLAAFDRVAETGTPELVLVSGYCWHRQVVGRQRTAQGARSTPWPVRVRQVRSGQARDPVCDARAGVAESRPPSARNQRCRAGGLARGVRRRVGPERAVDGRPCPRAEADYRRTAARPRSAAPRGAATISTGLRSGSFGCSRGRSIRSRFSSTICSGSTRPHSIFSRICWRSPTSAMCWSSARIAITKSMPTIR